MVRTLMAAVIAALVGLAVVTMAPAEAQACRCQEPDVARSYNNSGDVLRAQVIHALQTTHWKIYYARVQEVYKGCEREGRIVRLLTPVSSATCGATLQRGQTYLINGSRHYRGYISIHSCDVNRPFSDLDRDDIRFLNTRYNCCGDRCACVNSPEVNCFVDPCQVAPACGEGQCVSNYCGGCNAEFFDDRGNQVCQDVSCRSDEDCGDDTWCRPTEDLTTSVCVDFSGEGDYCGGFTPIWAQTRCAPGLICTDVPEFIADAPGRCRVPCGGNLDCAPEGYCSGNDACRDDGACLDDLDCELPGNEYAHILCVGYGVCDQGRCGWRCGDSQCRELGGVFFGFCDAILGFGVVDGRCQAISGCSAEGYSLFSSLRACESACR